MSGYPQYNQDMVKTTWKVWKRKPYQLYWITPFWYLLTMKALEERRKITMKLQLPEAIETYFQASNSYESSLLAKCFTEDAILYDEGLAFHGPTAIEAHIVEANNNLLVKTVVTNAVEKNGQTIVTATISGNFDGSPAALDFYFTMEGQKISTLKIVFAGE